jgi:ABC-2 type transport system permease protein
VVAPDGLVSDMKLRISRWAAERRLRRMMAVARIETMRLMRDRVAISLIALVPAVQIVLFGYAVNLDPKNVPIAIAGADVSSVERAARIVRETGYFKIIGEALPPGAAEQMVVAGLALVGIELPPPPDEEASDGAPARARVVVDATDPAAVRPALAALETAYWRKRATTFSLDDGAAIDVDWLYNPERRTAWTIVPGLVGVIVMISMLMLGALTLVRERERGSWESLLATPVDALDALIGKLSPYVVIGAAQGAVVVGLAQVLFGLPVSGGIWALLGATPVYSAANLLLGFAFSALAESQMQAMQGAVFFYLPSMLLSGFMFPFQGMPGWARAIGEVLPLTHFVRATRGVLLKGEGGALIGYEMWPVALFALAAAALALAAYRRRLD